jgi:GNAT superfamily N-acetyltransferase
VTEFRFEPWDPEQAPASELIAEMRVELNDLYETFSRLDNPPLDPSELRPPHGVYVVGFDGDEVIGGGGLRMLSSEVAEIKRMFVRPAFRSRGVARALLGALEGEALRLGYRATRLDTGPKQVHGLALYGSAGYLEVPAYNDNPFACFWGEKVLR